MIWDNIGLKQEDKNLAAYQIMAEVFDRLDIHSGTVFNYHQQRRQTKIIRQIWNCFSTIFFTESNTPMINMALRSKKDIW